MGAGATSPASRGRASDHARPIRPDRHRRRPGRLRRRHPRGAARHEDRRGGAGASGRHLPELGLHPDQGAAAVSRDQPPAAQPRRVRLRRRQHPLRPAGGGEAVARRGQAARLGRGPPAEEEQGHGADGRRQAGRQGHRRGGRQDADRAAHHPGHRRPRPAAAGAGGGRQADLVLPRGDGAASDAEIPAGDRLRRHRDRVRELLPQHGRRGDGGRSAGPDPAGGGCRDQRLRPQGVREAGHEDHHRRQGHGRQERAPTASPPPSRRAARRRRSPSTASSPPPASSATWRAWGWRAPRWWSSAPMS